MNPIYTQQYIEFIASIRNARRAKRVTQRHLAHMMGREQGFISRVETCEKLLNVVDFSRLTVLLELDAVKLLEGLSKGYEPITETSAKYDITPK